LKGDEKVPGAAEGPLHGCSLAMAATRVGAQLTADVGGAWGKQPSAQGLHGCRTVPPET